MRFGYCYYRDNLGDSSVGMKYLTSDEARRFASNIAKLPELLKRGD